MNYRGLLNIHHIFRLLNRLIDWSNRESKTDIKKRAYDYYTVGQLLLNIHLIQGKKRKH